MIPHRFGALTKIATRFSLQKLAFSAASPTRSPKFYTDDDDEEGSAVYRHALKHQRPTTIKWTAQLVNSVGFIGSVECPLKIIGTRKNGRFGAWTALSVKASPASDSPFRILVEMRDEMAQMCLKHLEPNDLVYVSGRLGSYQKALKTYYKVIVKELNYIDQGFRGPTSHKVEESQAGAGTNNGLAELGLSFLFNCPWAFNCTIIGGASLEVDENRLYLWQVFFSNPHEWWDNRKRKANPWQPDFRHKDTGETLWLRPNDPPWIKKQLQLLDTQRAEQSQDWLACRSRVSMWTYDE